MITKFTRQPINAMTICLVFMTMIGLFLMIAWASYSPLDNGWSVATSQPTLNKMGSYGAWSIDVLFALFGKVAFVVPFGVTFSALYALIFQLAPRLTFRQVAKWSASFLLLLIGLSGLSSVLFSHSAYYLSGGVVGGILGDLLSSSLGQTGVLLIGMLLTAFGFYFCSGQIMIQLATSLYQWVIEGQSPRESILSKNAEIPPLEQTPAQSQATETSAAPAEHIQKENIVDVSRFHRPNIIGLRPTQPSPSIPDNISQPVVNVSRFTSTPAQTHNDNTPPLTVPLMGITMPEVSIPSQQNEQAASKTVNILSDERPVFSTPSVEVETAPMPTVQIPDITEPTISDVSKVPMETPVVTISTENHENVAYTPPSFEPATIDDAEPLPEISFPATPISPATDSAVNTSQESATPAQPNYPKGYGETFIHPLLQQPKARTKPTTALPTLDLLSEHPYEHKQPSEQEILATSARIEQELANFGIKATVEDVLIGPVVTRYEIRPAPGVKAARISALGSDLARALIFSAIRITDTVPGKPFMGLETPNPYRETVWLRDVLDSDEFRQTTATLPMALGKDISGKPIVVDMAKMPHLLVAGQTGGGKSVGVNTMILSLLYKLTPEQVRFIMIDPKMVELAIYHDIPHLLTPVVTDMKEAENALRWAVDEMERRYDLVSKLNVRNIEGYNAKIDKAAEMNMPIPDPTWRPSDSMDTLPPPLGKLSYIVVIVDELADLMMTIGKPIEDHIMRIAQKARAVGIHLIIATQRPSTDVITGVIKANIPSRIAFTVASQIDSRTILGYAGAESLLGRGDMLYSAASSPDILRIHGAFMTDNDVENVADDWRSRGKPTYISTIVESPDDEKPESGDALDPLFDEVVEYVVESGVTSISGIQRRFSLGFNRAARILEQMERQGIVSAADRKNKRELLIR